jgi:NAD(P)-dependent dehydrogenase (short-subunit alcohol dehydrogenase family)
MTGKLQDRVAVVTGAGRGVGRAVALLFAREGAKVIVADNGSNVDGSGTSTAPAQQVVDEIQAAGGIALADTGDVSDWDQAEALINKPLETWGGLDILVNIAGNFCVNNVTNVTRADWDGLRRVHMDGMMFTSRFAARHWAQGSGYGRLLNMTSDSAMSGVPDTFAYAAAKSAVVGMTRAVANAMVNYGVTANCLTQGSSTRMGDSYFGPDADGRNRSDVASPEQLPEQVAPLVTYLASEAAAHISGRIFGAYGFKYIRWSEPHHERALETEDAWDLDDVFERFPETLGEGLSLESDLLWPMDSLEEASGESLGKGPGLGETR